jgi:ABC-type transport system involved in multi-copper enzyme maturation permease subunit
MNAYAQAKHIFWKEYRTQRSIWLGITLIIVVLQSLVYAMMPQNANDPLETLMSIGAILTTFYALASAGVLFAGEREEETDCWLMILPTSKSSLFGGKLFWLLCSWLLALGVTSLTGYLPYWRTELVSQELWKFFLSMLRYGGSMFAWGLFFSLVCRRVYTAIAYATVAFLLSGAMIQFMAGIMDLLTVIALSSSVFVGRRWLSQDRVIALPQFAIWADKFNLERALASSIESSPGWRMFRRQLWLEWRNARWLALGAFCGLFVIVFTVHWADSTFPSTTHHVLIFALLPLLVGPCTYRGEQDRQAYRFQSNVGASPLAIWSSKHLVWGLMLALIALPFVSPFFFTAQFGRMNSRWEIFRQELFQMLPLPEDALPYLLQDMYHQSAWKTVSLWLATMAFMYAIGHLCSLLVKRSVSCLLVAMAAGTILSYHLYATLMLNVPLFIAVGMPVTAMMIFSAWRTSGWLGEKNDAKDWLQTFGLFALLMLVCGSSWTMWRMYEITYQPFFTGLMALLPVTGLLTVSVGGFFLMILIGLVTLVVCRKRMTASRLFVGVCCFHVLCTSLCMSSFAAKIKPPVRETIAMFTPSQEALETGQKYRELELLVTEEMPQKRNEDESVPTYLYRLWNGQREVSEAQQAWLEENEQTLKRLVVNTQRPDCAPDDLFDVNDWADHKLLQPGKLQRLYSLLRLKALVLEKQGDLNAAWDIHHAIMNFHRHMSRHQLPQIRSWNLIYCRQYLHQDFVRWVNHAKQSTTLLTIGADHCGTVLAEFGSLSDSFQLQTTHLQWAVDDNMLGTWGGDDYAQNDWTIYLNQLIHSKWPMERSRAILMAREIADRETKLAGYLVNSHHYQVQVEISADDILPYDSLQKLGVFGYVSDYAIEESDDFWRLAASTPVIQASQTGRVMGLPTAIERPSNVLHEELEWLRYQKLVFLSMALRVAELEGQNNVDSLQELIALKPTSAKVAIVLNIGEQLFGEQTHQPHSLEEGQEWKSLLFYFDPVASGYLDMKIIKAFMNRKS